MNTHQLSWLYMMYTNNESIYVLYVSCSYHIWNDYYFICTKSNANLSIFNNIMWKWKLFSYSALFHITISAEPTLHPSTSYKYTSSDKVTQIYVIQQSIPTLQIILLFICSTKQKYNSMRKILNPMSRIAYRVFVFYFLLKWMMQFITWTR